MKKRVTTALLAACIAASLSLPCYAATGTIPPVSEVTQVVQALGIMNGDATGAMNPESIRKWCTDWRSIHLPIPRCSLHPLGSWFCGNRSKGWTDLWFLRWHLPSQCPHQSG